MHIDRVSVQNFRGVESAALEGCGRLNVLIGKNNSGKSTLLDAINGFLKVLSSGALVQLNARLGRAHDVRKESRGEPVQVCVDFKPDQVEFDDIRQLLRAGAPQMLNAVDTLTGDESLRITVTCITGDFSYAYISLIALHGSTEQRPHVADLYSISSKAATELAKKTQEATRHREISEGYQRAGQLIDPSDFRMITSEKNSYSSSFLSRVSTLSEVRFQVESLVRKSADYDEFRNSLETLSQASLETAGDIATAPLSTAIQTYGGEDFTIPAYVTGIITVASRTSFLHLGDRREPVGPEEASRLLALKVKRGGTDKLRKVQETVQSLMGVAIDAFESDPRSRSRMTPSRRAITAEMDVDEFLVELNGAGIREALRLVLDSELTEPSILLVEEPEIHLHPALEVSMLRYLKDVSATSQVFVTTHSTNFLDMADMQDVYLVSRAPTVTARKLSLAEAEEALPTELGIRLSSVFMYDSLVFVEGVSDEAIIRELASTLGVNLGRLGIGFVPIGGARNFSFYATEATLSFLSKKQVLGHFIVDRDEMSSEEEAKLSRLLNGRATLHILERRELENYLTIPRAAAELINEKRVAGGLPADVTESVVRDDLKAVAEELKEDVIRRRIARSFCAPLVPDRKAFMKGSPGDLSEQLASERERILGMLEDRIALAKDSDSEVRASIADRWPADSLSIAPGTEVLEGVFRRHGVAYRKVRDGQRLAELLTEKEIPAELQSLIRSFRIRTDGTR